jgi:gamma-glutamyltranspeptidase
LKIHLKKFICFILGGIFTLDDLKNYQAKFREPIEINLKGNYRMLAMPPPSSGVLVSLILNIMNSIINKKFYYTQ